MKRPLRLETFAPEAGGPTPDPALAEARQAGYEAGHRDGWLACEASAEASAARTREAVGTHLQGLAFSYQEARDHVLRGLEPLLHEIVAKLLPMLAEETLLPRILEHLLPLARDAAVAPVIEVATAQLAAAQDFLSRAAGMPFALRGRDGLDPGQAVLSAEDRERKIDLDGAVRAIAEAVNAFYQTHWPTPAPNADMNHD